MATKAQKHPIVDSDDESLRCFAINRDKKKPPPSKFRCALSQIGLTGSNAEFKDLTSLSMADEQFLEDVIRGEKADDIADLPSGEKAAAQTEENLRQGEWEQHVDLLIVSASNQAPVELASAATVPVVIYSKGTSSKKSFRSKGLLKRIKTTFGSV
jgi:hypothetical protein